MGSTLAFRCAEEHVLETNRFVDPSASSVCRAAAAGGSGGEEEAVALPEDGEWPKCVPGKFASL